MSGDFIRPLAGLRGIAALTVAWGHMRELTGLPIDPLVPALGVVLFFALSGFLMAHLYLSERFTPRSALRFVLARFGRVYPLFAVVVVAAALYSLASPTGEAPFGLHVDDIGPHLALYGEGGTVWTVAVEFQFYGIFLAIWAVCWLARFAGPRTIFCIIAIAVVAICLYADVNVGRNALLRYLHVFMIGGLAALVYERWGARLGPIAGWVLPLCLGVYLGAYFAGGYVYDNPVVLACVGLLVLLGAAGQDTQAGRILGSRPMVFLGEVSFGTYLLHRPVMFFWNLAFGEAVTGIPLYLILTAITLLLAWLAHLLIERPARSFVRSLSERTLGLRGHEPHQSPA